MDGTTDITQTVHFGKPSAHEKACYTAVFKGHIALDTAVFPNGTTVHALDILARVPLWKDGLDYRHGTGHGIGSYLNVHEGPHLISFKPQTRNVTLEATMTVTDEPGYYEDGNFGIRLENVLIIKEAVKKFNFSEMGYLLAGSAIGPGGLSFVSEMVQVEIVAQFGVVFLLFTLGLKFSSTKLRVVRAVAVLGGYKWQRIKPTTSIYSGQFTGVTIANRFDQVYPKSNMPL